jgi:DNA-binding NtrC family response regulator
MAKLRNMGSVYPDVIGGLGALEKVELEGRSTGHRLPERGAMKAPQRILLVDDDTVARQAAVRTLTDAGYEVVEAEDGEVALELLRRSGALPIDLVLTDLRMPRINGVQLGLAIERDGPSVPVVYMTGYADASMWLPDEIRQTRLVPKPFTPAALIQFVAWHLPPPETAKLWPDRGTGEAETPLPG